MNHETFLHVDDEITKHVPVTILTRDHWLIGTQFAFEGDKTGTWYSSIKECEVSERSGKYRRHFFVQGGPYGDATYAISEEGYIPDPDDL